MDQLRAAFQEARQTKGMPTAIIMKTVKGKGVSFMENQASWHGSAPNDEQYAVAMADLEKVGKHYVRSKEDCHKRELRKRPGGTGGEA